MDDRCEMRVVKIVEVSGKTGCQRGKMNIDAFLAAGYGRDFGGPQLAGRGTALGKGMQWMSQAANRPRRMKETRRR